MFRNFLGIACMSTGALACGGKAESISSFGAEAGAPDASTPPQYGVFVTMGGVDAAFTSMAIGSRSSGMYVTAWLDTDLGREAFDILVSNELNLAAGGTFACGNWASLYYTGGSFGEEAASTSSPTSCSITIDELGSGPGGEVAGTFTATLQHLDNSTVDLTDGRFRAIIR